MTLTTVMVIICIIIFTIAADTLIRGIHRIEKAIRELPHCEEGE